ncbi:response regulator [Treponema socranskii]|uniref:response regulator n=1 Tax=Treponema socranskii TaxID=53419 RepID=UPI0028EBC195|nr:response regulator [Treponema socranskii]
MEKSDIDPGQRMAFLANTVHEIRTPVQTIVGTLELLSDTRLNNEQQEYVRQIQFSTNVLLSLVNDILDFTKIKSRQIVLESIPYDVVALTEQVVDLVSMEAFGKGIELVVDSDYSLPQLVIGDPTRIQQVLLNIIKNAVKFTQSGYIHVSLAKKDETALLFEVADTGIGIPKEKQKHLFTDYYQAETSTTRKYGGTGLGLAICKGLVIAMNGNIGVRTNPDGGSVFWFTVPFSVAQNVPASNTKTAAPANTRILIVDDSPLALNSMRQKLNSCGLYNISYAKDAAEALLKMKNASRLGKAFSLVFIDMSLPKVDGWHLAWEIKECNFTDTKLYLLVPEGRMGAEAKMKLINLFNGYLYKPVKRQLVQSLLNDIYDIPTDLETLDAKQSKASEAAVAENGANITEGMTVLVAEDHPLNRKLIVTFLKKLGAPVIEAENGKQVVEAVEKNREINMIFMDIQMPVMDGIEAAKKIKAAGYTGIIVACTANNDENDFALYRKIGINDILVKPFKRDDIKTLIEKWHTVIELPVAPKITMLDSMIASENTTWNQKDFEDTIGGDIALGKELLAEYRKQLTAFVCEIEKAIVRKDFETLGRIGHTIKGSSAAIGAYVLSNRGAHIEKEAEKQGIENIQKDFIALKDEFVIFEFNANEWKRKWE